MTPIEHLARDAASLGVPLSAAQAKRLLDMLDELARWNRSYNLTAITSRADMITHHLLDSLAIHPDLAGPRIADLGTGAGFPGLPLALVNPERHFTLIDSNGKKIRFIEHALRTLDLGNVTALHVRAEECRPAMPFDTVIARAFGSLAAIVAKAGALVAPGGRILAMKGRWPAKELEELPLPWRLAASRELSIPGLDAARCLLVVARTA